MEPNNRNCVFLTASQNHSRHQERHTTLCLAVARQKNAAGHTCNLSINPLHTHCDLVSLFCHKNWWSLLSRGDGRHTTQHNNTWAGDAGLKALCLTLTPGQGNSHKYWSVTLITLCEQAKMNTKMCTAWLRPGDTSRPRDAVVVSKALWIKGSHLRDHQCDTTATWDTSINMQNMLIYIKTIYILQSTLSLIQFSKISVANIHNLHLSN